jgi:sugar phosphate isomerase/epimerase
MKNALDPFMHRHLSLEALPAKVVELGCDWIELSPRGDFLCCAPHMNIGQGEVPWDEVFGTLHEATSTHSGNEV